MRVRLRVDNSEITFVKENESFDAEVREWCVGVGSDVILCITVMAYPGGAGITIVSTRRHAKILRLSHAPRLLQYRRRRGMVGGIWHLQTDWESSYQHRRCRASLDQRQVVPSYRCGAGGRSLGH